MRRFFPLRKLLVAAYVVGAVATTLGLSQAAMRSGGATSQATAAPLTATATGPTVSKALVFGESKPASEIVPTEVSTSTAIAPEESEGALIHPVGAGTFSGPDAALQQGQPSTVLPPTNHNFDGQSIGDNGILAGAPPDTNGDVGPNDYVQIVNQVFSVYDKRTGAQKLGPLQINSLWQDAIDPTQQNCTINNPGDPVVAYDPLANRWLITQFGFSTATLLTGQPIPPFDECIAISKTGDPTGAYYVYDFSLSITDFEDYPKLGVWPDGYYLTMNQFDGVTLEFHSTDACAFERDEMIAGNPDARLVCFNEADFDPGATTGNFVYGGQLPSDLDGEGIGSNFSGKPPAGSPNYFMQFLDSTTAGQDKLLLFKFHVDWSNPANSWFGTGPGTGMGKPIEIPVADFSANLCDFGNTRNCLPQLEGGSADKLDSIPDRLMNRLAYRNFGDHEALVANHTVSVGDAANHAGIRWYEIRDPNGTPTVYQQSTFSPDAEHRWMGSAAMDKFGDIGLGYSLTSASRNPAIAYAARLWSEPQNQLGLGQQILYQGPGSQLDTGNRWGDYSSISVDPNGCDFWYTTEYQTGTASFQWGTRIGSFTIPTCGDPQVSVAASGDLVRVGRNFTYTIGVTAGEDGSPGTVVQDVLPAGVTLLDVRPSVGTCTGTTTISCNVGNLPPGAYETIRLDVHSGTTGTLKNTVTMSTTSSSDDTGNDVAEASTEIYTPCAVPGAVFGRDQTGDSFRTPQQDLEWVAVGEPSLGAGVNRLVFTIKVADLTAPTPNTIWYEHFSYGGVHYFVDMSTADTPVPTFDYGRVDFDPSLNVTRYRTIGAADSGSFSTDGTITIALSNDKLVLNPVFGQPDNGVPPKAGDTLRAMFGQVHLLAGAAGSGALITLDNTRNAAYTLAGNIFCAPNAAPTAALAASPTSGQAPLSVAFDASGSSDADSGDTVASYTFHFGDGSTPVTQATPTISHTYSSAGDYTASVTVTDSRGLDSTNVAGVDVHAAPPATPPSADLAVTKTGPATGRVGKTLTYTIKVTNNGPDAATGVTAIDALPKSAAFGSASTTQGLCSPQKKQPTVTCNIGAMASGATVTVTITVKPTAKGDLTDKASVSAASPDDPVSGNNTSSVTTTITK